MPETESPKKKIVVTPADLDPRAARNVVVRLFQFSKERFLPVPQVILIVAMVFAAAVIGAQLVDEIVGESVKASSHPRWLVLLGAVALGLLSAMRLRINDDTKDAAYDREHESDRPVARGLVSTRELDVYALVILAIEGGIAAAISRPVLITWTISAVYTLAMRLEFGIPHWLERHVLTNAIVHMAVLVPMTSVLVACGVAAADIGVVPTVGDLFTTPELVIFYAASVLFGIGFELGRKFERYFAAHGVNAYILLMLCPCSALILVTLLARVSGWLTTVLVCAATACYMFIEFAAVVRRRVDPGTAAADFPVDHRKRIEFFPGVSGLIAYTIFAVGGLLALGWGA